MSSSASSSNVQQAAHFTSTSTSTTTTGSSLALPSVFELLAEERLSDLIRPCVQKVLQFLHENRPLSNILRVLYKYKDEFILLIEGIIQWLYLHSYSALIGERFYGFKRTADHRLRSLIISVFLPYVKVKLDSLYEQMRANSTNRSDAFYLMLKILPKVQIFLEGVCWLYRIGYAFGRTEYYSPALQLAGVKLVYAQEPTVTDPPKNFSGRLFANINKIMSSGLFLIQFVDWWNNASGTKAKNAGTAVRPPVPSAARSPRPDIGRRQCPLCHKPCNVPTAIVGSGYVYCYTCISSYVTKYQRCPTTNQPVTMAQVVKVYGQ